MSKPIVTIIDQGAPRVNEDGAYILREGPGFAAVIVDMQSKRCVVGCQACSDEQPPHLWIEADENTLHLDETKPRDAGTCIEFSRWRGWTIFCADITRYTLSVCLVDNHEPKEQSK